MIMRTFYVTKTKTAPKISEVELIYYWFEATYSFLQKKIFFKYMTSQKLFQWSNFNVIFQ